MTLHCVDIFIEIKEEREEGKGRGGREGERKGIKDTFARIDVPQLDGSVAGPSDELVALELEAVDHVVVTLEGVHASA